MITTETVIDNQRRFFNTGSTHSYTFRRVQLNRLKQLVKQYEPKILAALKADLSKGDFEGWVEEIGVIEQELNLAIKHLSSWMSRQKLPTPLLHAVGTSFRYPEPYGNTLVISPWNYPFLLALRPAIGAIAAGNTCIIKPSEFATHTSQVLEDMINNHFDSRYLFVLNTDAAGTQQLLQHRFSFIFFTGSPAVGKLIAQAAAKHLTPVTLELGGKNPCIVDADINMEIAARRIVWGKFSNAGQTCVAPDYLLVHASISEKFIALLIDTIRQFYGDEPATGNDYGRMIHQRQFDRIAGLIAQSEVIYGGQTDVKTLFIAPTITRVNHPGEPVMQEEIFGPVLPVITFDTPEEAFGVVAMHPDPLVAYLFSRNDNYVEKFLKQIPAGDACINDVVVHFGHSRLPIGGRGNSGTGKYQGRYNFEAFTHWKSVLKKNFVPDLPMRYPPYNEKKLNRMQQIFKWFF